MLGRKSQMYRLMDVLVYVTRMKEESGNSVCAKCILGP